jgi:hypothetical protein
MENHSRQPGKYRPTLLRCGFLGSIETRGRTEKSRNHLQGNCHAAVFKNVSTAFSSGAKNKNEILLTEYLGATQHTMAPATSTGRR